MRNLILLLKKIAIFNTIFINFRLFPYNIALRFPVIVYKNTKFVKMKGNIVLNVPIKTGLLKIGVPCLGLENNKKLRTIIELQGTLIVNGNSVVGKGCRISIAKEARLTFGPNFSISGRTEIICQKEITFGGDCLLSWDILIMDTDFHKILIDNIIINKPKPILIGNHVWIGCRNTILKGVTIADNTIISANSTITQSFPEKNCIIGGNGKMADVIKRNINWIK